jgi:hypothetical protein
MVLFTTRELLFLLATDNAWGFLGSVSIKSIATAQNDRYKYLVLTCRRVFAMVLPVSLGPFL